MAEKPTASDIVKFNNCRLLKDCHIFQDDLWVRDGRILNPQAVFFDEKANPEIVVDCGGHILAPGYIEVQINGAYGKDFSYDIDNVKTNIQTVAKELLSHGVTSFCPTIVTSHSETYKKVIKNVCKTEGSDLGAGVLGLHLEGPFISKNKNGAHPENLVQDAEPLTQQTLESMYGVDFYDKTSILTLAPEITGSLSCIQHLTARGVCVSIGHSEGTLKDGEKSFKAGARFITHLFNAMLPFHHRDPGLVGLLTSWRLPARYPVFYGLIADGIHTHPATMRIAQRTNNSGCVLVSDAISAAGLSVGRYHLGTQMIDVTEEKAVIAGTNTLCGSKALLDECVEIFYEATECSKVDALEAATLHPAQLLGIENEKGSLNYGSDADFILLNDDLQVQATYIAGQCVWKKTVSRE